VSSESEKTFIKTRDEAGKSGSGNVWDKVTAQIDFNTTGAKKDTTVKTITAGLSVTNLNSSSAMGGQKPSTAGSSSAQSAVAGGSEKTQAADVKKDTSRLKNLLLQLKNDPKAPGNEMVAAR
jgi:hypothetical protein